MFKPDDDQDQVAHTWAFTPRVGRLDPADTTRHGDTVLDGRHGALLPVRVGESFGAYQLLEEIGSGGVGVVHRAEQSRPRRIVALKILERGSRATDDEIRRLQAEADAAASLDHPGIVPVYEVGEVDGCHFLAMAYVAGGTLSERLGRGPLPGREAATLLGRIAEAVAFAHERGVVHRDLKPSNILLDADGSPRVADFGLARMQDSDSRLTVTGQIMGTPSYMSPEQADGRTHEVGPASDVYALGGILYCMLTGRPPFQGATLTETLMQVTGSDPVAPTTLNPHAARDLETICLKCLEKSPERRYGSAAEVAEEIRRHLDGRPIRARRLGPLGRGLRWCRHNTVTAMLLALVTVSLIGGAALSTYFAIQAHDRAREIERLSRELVALAVEVRETEQATVLGEDGWPVTEKTTEFVPGSDVGPGGNVPGNDGGLKGNIDPPAATPVNDPAAEPNLVTIKDPQPVVRAEVELVPTTPAAAAGSPSEIAIGSRFHLQYARDARDKRASARSLQLRGEFKRKVEQLKKLAPGLADEFDEALADPPERSEPSGPISSAPPS